MAGPAPHGAASPASSAHAYAASRGPLPSEWDRRPPGRMQLSMQYLKVDGVSVKYIGPGDEDNQAAAVRADQPVPNDVPLFYFEVEVINKGDKGFIGMQGGQVKRACMHALWRG